MDRPTTNPRDEQANEPEMLPPVASSISAKRKSSPAIGYGAGLLAFAVLGCLIYFGLVPRLEQQSSLIRHTKEALAQAPSVSVVVAEEGPEIQEINLPGATEAIQDAPIYARVNGYLNKRYVNIGDLVHKGQVLADIDTPELDQQVLAAVSAEEQAHANLDNTKEALQKAQADLRSAAANSKKAGTDLQYYSRQLERYKSLMQQGAVSAEDLDTRTQNYNAGVANLESIKAAERSAEATVNSAKAAIHVAEAAWNAASASRKQFQATQSFKRVTALFDGIVVRRNVDAGVLISAGGAQSSSLLFEIAKTDVLRVFVYVPEPYVPYIHKDQEATLKFQEFPNRRFVGTVSNVAGGIDPASRTLQVELHVPNQKNELLPGMYAQVTFKCPAKVRSTLVPATTLQTRADGAFMYVIDSKNYVHMHKIEIGRDLGGQFEITSGIKPGDRVIVAPSDMLRTGMRVSPVLQEKAPAEENK
jgi:RND family efflux transporter MFP subunit